MNDYEKANHNYGIAFAEYDAVLLSYRARKCSVAEFLAAKAEFAKANAAFDVAYAAEIQRLEEAGIDDDWPQQALEAVDETPEKQIDLF